LADPSCLARSFFPFLSIVRSRPLTRLIDIVDEKVGERRHEVADASSPLFFSLVVERLFPHFLFECVRRMFSTGNRRWCVGVIVAQPHLPATISRRSHFSLFLLFSSSDSFLPYLPLPRAGRRFSSRFSCGLPRRGRSAHDAVKITPNASGIYSLHCPYFSRPHLSFFPFPLRITKRCANKHGLRKADRTEAGAVVNGEVSFFVPRMAVFPKKKNIYPVRAHNLLLPLA